MDINLRIFRIFIQVYKDKSFSTAARNLGITQPTISQQIQKLENEVGTRLFERVGKSIIPTQKADDFYTYASQVITQTDEFLDVFRSGQMQPRGTVRYAMPESCQWTPHYKKIMSQLSHFPDINCEIDITSSEQIVTGILEGKYDFGFFAGEKLSPDLSFEKFSDEKYVCVAKTKKDFVGLSKDDIAPRIVAYNGWEAIFIAWAKTQGLFSRFKRKFPKPVTFIGPLAGAIHAVCEGAGVAVLPYQCVADKLEIGELYEFKVKSSVTSNPIYLSKKIGSKLPTRCQLILDLLKQAKAELG